MSAMNPRVKGTLAALALFVMGGVAGVAGDRIWLGRAPTEAQAASLTPEAMAQALHLDNAQGARVRSVLDSLQGEVSAAAQEGPDSLRSVAERARRRLEDALPADRRPEFVQWMRQHHDRMMRRMRAGMMNGRGGMGPGMMRGPGGGRGGRGPGVTPPDSSAGNGKGPGMMRRRGRGGRGMMGSGTMGRDTIARDTGGSRMHR